LDINGILGIAGSRFSLGEHGTRRTRKQSGCNEKGPGADCSQAFALGNAAKGARLRRRPLQQQCESGAGGCASYDFQFLALEMVSSTANTGKYSRAE